MEGLRDEEGPSILAFVLFGLFCGIRRGELYG